MTQRMPLFLCFLVALPSLATAAGWNLREGDRPFDNAELAALPGQSYRFYDDGRSDYGNEGNYSYTYSAANGGGTAWGHYHIAEDGSVCVTFENGRSRCDLYVRNEGRIVLITETGERYPVRP